MWQRGVRRNDKIVVILPRGIGQVAALLGILAIGAAYVPIAMKQPLGRRKKIIENVKPALVLQDEAFLEENPWTGCIENNSKDTAYIIYTSGSSGEPKGVEMSHVAAMNTKQVGMDQWTWRLTYKVFCGKNIVSTVDSLMSWNYQSVEKILNQLTKMHFRTAKLSETLLLAIKAR